MEEKRISAWSILFALLFYTGGVWANESEAINAGTLFILMAVLFGFTAILSVVTSNAVMLVVSTIVMLFVGVYIITPIASEAIQEMVNLLLKALMEAVDSVGWVIPAVP